MKAANVFMGLVVLGPIGYGAYAVTQFVREMNLPQEEKRKLEVAALFDADGSMPKLINYIRDRMNDPDSFVHVKTTHKDLGHHVMVDMVYRGKNAFGGVITEAVYAEVDIKGEVVKVWDDKKLDR